MTKWLSPDCATYSTRNMCFNNIWQSYCPLINLSVSKINLQLLSHFSSDIHNILTQWLSPNFATCSTRNNCFDKIWQSYCPLMNLFVPKINCINFAIFHGNFTIFWHNGYHLVVQHILLEINALIKFDGVLRQGAVMVVLITFSDSSSCHISWPNTPAPPPPLQCFTE